MRSTKMLWIGGVMLVGGWLLVFAILIGLVPATYFLNFFGYAVSFAGLVVGLIGMLEHVRPRR